MIRNVSLLLIFLLHVSPIFAQNNDIKGSSDHPLLSRVPGADIIKYDTKSFDEVVLPLGEFKFFDGVFEDKQRVEGTVHRIGYRIPQGRSTLEVFRSYKKALTEHDAEVLFECSGETECGNGFDNGIDELPGEEDLFSAETVDEDSQRYLAARLNQSGREVYVMVYTYYQYSTEKPFVRLRIIETETEQEQLVMLNADALRQALDQQGRVIVQGIYFDTDKATIRPASESALKEMGRVLMSDPNLLVYIVGHTDDTGSFDYNMKLSQWRAKAVSDYLIGNYDVNPDQLTSHGVGPLAPVAPNMTEQGRQQNRRVEMVKRKDS